MTKSLIRLGFRPGHPGKAGNRLNEPARPGTHPQDSHPLTSVSPARPTARSARTGSIRVLPPSLRPHARLSTPPSTRDGSRPMTGARWPDPARPAWRPERRLSAPTRRAPSPTGRNPTRSARPPRPRPGVGALRPARLSTRRGAGFGSAGQVCRTSGGEGKACSLRAGARRAGRPGPASGTGLSRGGGRSGSRPPRHIPPQGNSRGPRSHIRMQPPRHPATPPPAHPRHRGTPLPPASRSRPSTPVAGLVTLLRTWLRPGLYEGRTKRRTNRRDEVGGPGPA